MKVHKMNENQFDWMLALVTGMIGAQLMSVNLLAGAVHTMEILTPALVDLIKFFGAIVGGLLGSALTMYGKYKIEEMKIKRDERLERRKNKLPDS